MTTELEKKIDSADALADTILQTTARSIEAGEIDVEDAGVAYLAVAVRLLSICSPQATVASILRANADVVDGEGPDSIFN